jgi:hypothetical protein
VGASLPKLVNPNALHNVDPIYYFGILRNDLENTPTWRLKAIDLLSRPEFVADLFLKLSDFSTPMRISFFKNIQTAQNECLKFMKLNKG